MWQSLLMPLQLLSSLLLFSAFTLVTHIFVSWFVTYRCNIATMSTSSKIVVVSSLYMLLACLILLYTTAQGSRREALDFTIGVGSGSKDRDLRKACNDEHHTLPFKLNCPLPRTNIETLPAVPSESEILVFADQRLAVVYPVIQRFKSIITSDPLGITKTWVGSDICSYKGFYCDYPPDNKSAVAVASIDFTGFQLSAPTLDGFLDQLPDIALFHANSNNFSGTLSPNIAKLRYLYELDISNNQFSGPFPTAVLGMTGLTFLDIRFKFFTGSVPAQIFTQDLDALFINNNNFMIQLPENIGETHVLFLTLANNKFNGPLPRSIFKAFSSLPEVLLLNDQLTGCIPYEIGLLKEAVVFDAGNNQLTGHLPFSLACLENLEQLNFAGNLLFGTVPEVLCELGKLVNLSLSDNYFTHVGPLCRILIERGVLDVRNNCIPDLPFQKSVADCANFFAHPRTCPRMWSYTNIPCSHFPYSSSIPEMAPSP